MIKRILPIFAILLLSLVLISAVGIVSVSSVSVSPTQPGKTTQITILLENQGTEDVENIVVSLDLSSELLPFAPVGSAAEKVVDEIKEDRSKTVNFELITLPEAKPQIYKIPLKIKYNEIEQLTVISVEVASSPVLEVALEESSIFKVGDTGEVIIRFVNKGLSDIKFLSVELVSSPDYDLLSAQSFYIGNIEPDDFETTSFKLHLNNKINFIPVKVSYKDTNNKDFIETQFLSINIFTQEEAKKLGLTETSITPYIIGIIVLIILLFFVIRKIRKRRKEKLGI